MAYESNKTQKSSTGFCQKAVLLFTGNQYWFLSLSTEHTDISTVGNNFIIVDIINFMLYIGEQHPFISLKVKIRSGELQDNVTIQFLEVKCSS
jgi:hypothetical protein